MTNQKFFSADLIRAREVHKQPHGFILTRTLRDKLYDHLFYPILENSRYRPGSLFDEYVTSMENVVRNVEGFFVEALYELVCEGNKGNTPYPPQKIPANSFPPLSSFVEDIFVLLLSLRENIQFGSIRDPGDWMSSKFRDSWISRWKRYSCVPVGIDDTALFRPFQMSLYYCGLCDVLLGLWPAPGWCQFHRQEPTARKRRVLDTKWTSARNLSPRCISSGLYFWEEITTSPLNAPNTFFMLQGRGDAPPIETLKAAWIEERVPFKFVSTKRISEHLTISDSGQIRVFTDWRRFLMLKYNRILPSDTYSPNLPPFQFLTSGSDQSRRNQPGGPDIHMLAMELLQTYVLLFYQDEYYVESPRGRMGRLGQAWRFGSRTPSRIADRIGIQLGKETIMFEEILSIYEHQFGPASVLGSKDFSIFRQRLEHLVEVLGKWKPVHFWDLKYPGYGSVDAVALYGFYFALFIGVVTFLTIALTAIQTWVAIKPLNSS